MANPVATTPHMGPQAEVAIEPVDNSVLGLWIWLSAEAVFFASLIGTYLLMHTHTNGGLTPKQVFDLPTTLAGTLILLASSMTFAIGYAQLRAGNLARFRAWVVLTVILGLGFLSFQAYEFTGDYKRGLTLQSSPFGSAFFTLTGFHGMHVAFGVFWLLSLLAYSYRKEFQTEGVTKAQVAGLYWHFVDVVWVVIFSVVYLLGKVG